MNRSNQWDPVGSTNYRNLHSFRKQPRDHFAKRSRMPPLRLEDNFHSSQTMAHLEMEFLSKKRENDTVKNLGFSGNFPFSPDKVSQEGKMG